MFKLPIDMPTYDITRASMPPALDGWLDSPAWQGARWVDTFVTVETGKAGGKLTRAAMLWDDQYLYVGFVCDEPAPANLQIRAATAREAWNDDCVEIYLNPPMQGAESVDIAINPLGLACPAIRVISDPGWGTYQFREPGGIRTASRFTGHGWQLEIAIPFGENGMPAPKAGDSWTGNLCRNDKLGFTWSFWALEPDPPYKYNEWRSMPNLRFTADSANPAAAPTPVTVRWPRQPRFALRGLMYDTSRGSQVYTPAYWIERLPLFKELGLNLLLMYFENHLHYPTHNAFAPEGSWTLTDLRKLQDAAAKQGIDVIPGQTTLGHCPGILTHPQYAHLAEAGSDGYQFCTAHPETYEVLGSMLAELATASRSEFVNVNCDESAYLGLCPRCQPQFAGWSKGRILREHLLKLHAVLQRHGKRMMMWDDMLWLYPEATEGLPRDIVLLDWHYCLHRRYPSVDAWRKLGFDVVVCPATTLVENAMWIGDYGAAHGCLGIMNTLWEEHSLPLGWVWRHLLATSWTGHAAEASDLDAWHARAAAKCFGPAAARLGRSLAGLDKVRRSGYRYGGPGMAPQEFAALVQVRDEAAALLCTGRSSGLYAELIEEFVYALRLQVLQAEVARARADGALAAANRQRLIAEGTVLRDEGMARWARQCCVPSQMPAFVERYTAMERELAALMPSP